MAAVPFAGILSFLTGLPIKAAVDAWSSIQTQKLNLAVNESSQAHDERMKELEGHIQLLMQMAKERLFLYFLIFLSTPAALVPWQYIVFDKFIAGWWGGHKTDDLSQNLWNYTFMVFGFWLLRTGVNWFKRS